MPHLMRDGTISRIRKSLRGVDGLLVTDMTNVRYLTGFTGSSGFSLITKRAAFFSTDFRYKEQAGDEVSEPWQVVIHKGDILKAALGLSRKAGLLRLAFESSSSYAFYEGLKKAIRGARPMNGAVEKLRAVKDEGEIALIEEAVKRAEAAFIEVKPHIRAGVRENSIARRLEDRLRRHGCRRLPFDIIVASGANSARPHAGATEKKLARGDLVTVDWGGEAHGYVSDMTRTLLLNGPDTARKKEIFKLVLEANRRGISAVSPKAGTREVDAAVRGYIAKAGYGREFGHGLGHGVGLQVHEAPSLNPRRNTRLKEGMVFTIEPGIYLPGMGGVRIEDMVTVEVGGARLLTSLPRGLETIS